MVVMFRKARPQTSGAWQWQAGSRALRHVTVASARAFLVSPKQFPEADLEASCTDKGIPSLSFPKVRLAAPYFVLGVYKRKLKNI